MRPLYIIAVITIVIQIVGPLICGFGNWANIIQYVSGFGMAYALYEYFINHKRTIRNLEQQIIHLHNKVDERNRNQA